MKKNLLLLAFFTFTNLSAQNMLKLPAIFSDNMVLQQNTEVTFWGKAEPGSDVTIRTDWNEKDVTTTDDNGNWSLKIKTPSADGGEYQVNISSGEEEINYENVLIGEVWLGSGQSNMEMPLRGWPPNDTIMHSEKVIAEADNPKIRLFTVARAFSHKPEFDCTGEWLECTPATAADFSATAYFFGKKLYEELNVPIGLIHSSWGGTPVEAWIGKEYIGKVEAYKETVANLSNSVGEIEKYNAWLKDHETIDVSVKGEDTRWENLELGDELVPSPDYNVDDWKTMNLPALWENTELGIFDGVVWFRKNVEIPTEWINKDLILELGPIDDMDRTYVNGQLVGSHEKSGFWQIDRVYEIPAEIVNDENLTIAVRVLDNQGGGGIYGDKEKLNLHPANSDEKISLTGEWKYLPAAEFKGMLFYVFDIETEEYYSSPEVSVDLSPYTPTALYNAMIDPLVPFTIRGAIWYQGESNVGNPAAYETLFPMMIKNWRDVWKVGDFPFYYVQIAPYDYGEDSESQKLREAQLKTLSVPNTGMAVTLDIGNPKNIHPANKLDVGNRLARWALAKTYNKDIDFSGPIYKSMEVKEGKAVLTFDYVDQLIYKPEVGTAEFLIAGEDKEFKKAKVEIDGNKLILSHPEVSNPAVARYAWSNTDSATLFDENGLPASSFRTDER